MVSQKWWKIITILLVLQIPCFRGSSEYVMDKTWIQNIYTTAVNYSDLADTGTLLDNQIQQPDVISLHIHSNIKYRYATTVVTSRAINPAHIAQTVNFTVVLPESAFITGFTMMTDDKTYKSLVKETVCKNSNTQTAEKELPTVHFEKSDARDSKQFTVAVNVKPFMTADFNLTYGQMLTRSLEMYHHVVNMNPRQIIPDLSVTVKIIETAEIVTLQIQEINKIGSSSSTVAITERPHPTAIINWVLTPQQQIQIAKDGVNGQLIVKYDVDRQSNPQQILIEGGYFVHFFAPESIPALHKHLIFILDYSGSLSEYEKGQTRNAMKTAVTDLDPSDYFSLVLFSEKAAAWYPFVTKFTDQLYEVHSLSNEVRSPIDKDEESYGKDDDYDYGTEDDLSHGVLPASRDNKELAIEFLESFTHYATTNVMDGLRKGINVAQTGKTLFQNSTSKPEPLIVLLTDGNPTVEIFDTEEIIREVEKLNTDRIPIFCIDWGHSNKYNFLHKLSLKNNAFVRKVDTRPYSLPIEQQLVSFYKEISSPMLTDIHFNYYPDQINSTLTSRVYFPVYFNGSEIVVVGRLLKSDPVSTGELLANTSTVVTKYPIVIHSCHPHYVPGIVHESVFCTSDLEKIWAHLILQQLMDKITTLEGKEYNDAKRKAVDLALQYSFKTELTSLIVVRTVSASPANNENIHHSENLRSGTLQSSSNDTVQTSFK